MRIYRTKTFTRLARKAALKDTSICQAINEMNQGLIDANLGSGLFKKESPCLVVVRAAVGEHCLGSGLAAGLSFCMFSPKVIRKTYIHMS